MFNYLVDLINNKILLKQAQKKGEELLASFIQSSFFNVILICIDSL